MWLLSELAMCANSECMLGCMGSCRNLHDWHNSSRVGWRSFVQLILSSYIPFWYNYNIFFTFSNSHFFSGQSRHASSSSIVLSLAWGQKAYYRGLQKLSNQILVLGQSRTKTLTKTHLAKLSNRYPKDHLLVQNLHTTNTKKHDKKFWYGTIGCKDRPQW